MAAGETTELALTTAESGDTLPQDIVKANFEILDQFVAASKLTNKSGAQVTAGAVLIADTTADSAFDTTTTVGLQSVIGIAQATIEDDAAGIVKSYGKSSVAVTAATSRGDWLTTSGTLGKALSSSDTTPPVGTFAIALSATGGSGTVTAMLFPSGVRTTTRSIQVVIDGGGAAISDGDAVFVEVPYDGTIISFRLLADVSGTIKVVVVSDTFANYPPTNPTDDISNDGLTISGAVKAEDTTLTSWTTSLTAGKVIGFIVEGGATTITRVTCSLVIVEV